MYRLPPTLQTHKTFFSMRLLLPRSLTTAVLALTLCFVFAACDDGPVTGEPRIGTDADPPVPSAVTAESGDAEVSLTWEGQDPASNFRATSFAVYRDTAPFDDVDEDLLLDETGSDSFTDAEVQNGTTYYYRITGFTGDTEGQASEQVSVTPFAEPGRPSLTE